MNAQEKQAQYQKLAEFYCQAAEGGVAQFYSADFGWRDANSSPSFGSDLTKWRIKPALKAIDLTPLIGSGILCEFWTNQSSRKIADFLESIDVVDGMKFFRREGAGEYLNCTPMMNHPNYWRGESAKCPVPEGFEVRLHFRDGDVRGFHFMVGAYIWRQLVHANIIGIEFIAVKEGYTLTPTC
jgi:hypothetical protein